ncbi:hypothetical protein GJ699_25755 [Duganella sp. FT80W]|uniref:Uncharacterized protein n=1 Tax=Duganella guangzhouensis TaxID=2666084 RepID=A0A6I2LAU9_9BURK|nr:DUF6587 family protein [Duganella guangzhouensis]MRW93399.1 hypothetical protein [Duganella guangzhouensis]
MWQEIIVALIVIAALAHFCTKYLPEALRRQIVIALSKRGYDEAKLSKVFNLKSGCGDDGGGCSSCGSCDTTPTKSNPATPHQRVIKLHVQR